ncbi:MAG: hypothetical protein ACE5JJ_01065, partial [Nitrospinota bacterium]
MHIDRVSTTARGLFLKGLLGLETTRIPLHRARTLREGDLVAVRVEEIAERAAFRELECLERVDGEWHSREVPLRVGETLVLALGGRFASRSVEGRVPEAGVSPGE